MSAVSPGPGDAFAAQGAEVVRAAGGPQPEAAVILGSGLGDAVRDVEPHAMVPYAELPGFPPPTVPGHAGRLVVGRLAGTPVAAFLGRVHFYEGHPMSLVTLPARLAAALGIRLLVVTAAVGGLDPDLEPGTLVVGADHLNMLGESPLRGWRDPAGHPPFVDLSGVWADEPRAAALEEAAAMGLPAVAGVYAAMPGPAFETRAEIGFLRQAGATVAGMSVVPEAHAAAALGMRCLGLYCVTNRTGAGVEHSEVTRVAGEFAPRLGALLARLLGDRERMARWTAT